MNIAPVRALPFRVPHSFPLKRVRCFALAEVVFARSTPARLGRVARIFVLAATCRRRRLRRVRNLPPLQLARPIWTAGAKLLLCRKLQHDFPSRLAHSDVSHPHVRNLRPLTSSRGRFIGRRISPPVYASPALLRRAPVSHLAHHVLCRTLVAQRHKHTHLPIHRRVRPAANLEFFQTHLDHA